MRTRFAPAPTGPLHAGGARTALFNYLLTRANGGDFVVRFEDTDADACTNDARDRILRALDWLGLDRDAGPDTDPMYAQSNRSDRYRTILDRLIGTDAVYPCYCSEDRLKRVRDRARDCDDPPGYDGHCRDLDPSDALDRNPVYRVRVPDTTRTFDDAVKGDVTVDFSTVSDFVIARSDGSVTYNLAVVVDDHDMSITHVLRGDDHLSNVPKQTLLYDILNWDTPHWAHLPLVHGTDGKLSSSNGGGDIGSLRDDGYLSLGVVNWLARLGWSPDNEGSLRSLDELADRFDLSDLKSGSATLNPDKLDYFNRETLKALDDHALADRANRFVSDDRPDRDRANWTAIAGLLRSYCDTLTDLRTEYDRYFTRPDRSSLDELADVKGARSSLSALLDTLDSNDPVDRALDRAAVEGRPFYRAIYLALCANGSGPPLSDYVDLLGSERVRERLNRGLEVL